jgi:hypothetical protein
LVGCTLLIYTHGWLTLAVRVRVRLRTKEGREELTVALVNSGFESDRPQILTPISLARRLDLWGRVLIEGGSQISAP